jgi:hypothetical protein
MVKLEKEKRTQLTTVKFDKEKKSKKISKVHENIENYTSGKDLGELFVSSLWKDTNQKTILTENTYFIFEKKGKDRWITRVTKLKAGADTVRFEDNIEGMLGLRLARFLEMPGQKPEIYLDAKGNPTSVPIMNNAGVSGNFRNKACYIFVCHSFFQELIINRARCLHKRFWRYRN